MNKSKNALSALKYLSLITEIGFAMLANIFVGIFIGNRIDQWLGLAPIFLFIFSILGVLSGIRTVYALIMKLGSKR